MKNRLWLLLSLLLLVSVTPIVQAKTDKSTLQNKLDKIQSDLTDKQQTYDDLQSKIDIYEENLKSKQQEKVSLNSQIETLDQDIELTKAEIDQTQIEIDSLGLEIDGLEIKISANEEDIGEKQDQIGTLVRDLFNYDQQTYLEIALTNSTLSEFSTQVEYTKTVNNEFKTALDTLQDLKKQLKQDKSNLSEKKTAEEDKQTELITRQESLSGEIDYKENLLIEVQDDEVKFQQLINDIKDEQASYNAEISSLEKSARQTLDKLNQNNQKNTGTGQTDTLPSEFDPIWPVSGIVTTTFHDPNYIFRSYFEHDSIDIAAPYGTDLKAADSGVVAIVKYDGTPSYAYIMVVHANNFATIYGHVSQVYVEPDQVVQKGQVIAAIGGMPGTPGAGSFTTGPHVHFGVRLNGIPVDPLLYLP
ncbi:MAG: peptidase M23 [uncultured bacterium]|nr:MAG: peptidase M23 [uncultured bacterium]